MSAKALPTCGFEPAADHTAATHHEAPEGAAAEIQFREDLWHGYLLEAINAGFSAAQATEYATELSLAMDPVACASQMLPVGRGWFYQTRPGVARRTICSRLIELTQRKRSQITGRTALTRPARLVRDFRWWIAGGKS